MLWSKLNQAVMTEEFLEGSYNGSLSKKIDSQSEHKDL